jgi:hypothetical protein
MAIFSTAILSLFPLDAGERSTSYSLALRERVRVRAAGQNQALGLPLARPSLRGGFAQ